MEGVIIECPLNKLFHDFVIVILTSPKVICKIFLTGAGPIAKRSKSSDHGGGDPSSYPGGGRFFSAFFWDGELSRSHIVCFHT